MTLRVSVRKESPRRVDLELFEKAVSRILRKLGWKKAEVSILLTTDSKIKKIHRDYFKDNTPTDVISFPGGCKTFLGDLVISLDTAARQCSEYENTFSYEVLFYTAHGILHLMGHEDDTPEKSARMLKKQARVLKQAGLDRYSLVK